MPKMINVDMRDVALHALAAAVLKRTHPHLFNPSNQLSGLGRLRVQKRIQARISEGLLPHQAKSMNYTSANAAVDVITVIRNAVNKGWLNPKFLAPGWNFYTRMDQVAINALNALVAIQITVTQNKTNKSELNAIQNEFLFPIDKIFEQIKTSIGNVCGGAWYSNKGCSEAAMGVTSKQLDLVHAVLNVWPKARQKIFDMFNKDGLYQGQGWLSTVITIVAAVAVVAAPALIFASAGIGAGGAAGAAATGAATGGTAATGGALSTAATAASAASGAAGVAKAVTGGSKAVQAASDATKAVSTTADAIKTGGTLATNVAKTVTNSGILADAQKIAGVILASKGVNPNAQQSQSAIQSALQQAQQYAQAQLQNGNVKANANQAAPASSFTISKMFPWLLSGGAVLMEVMKK